MWSSSGRIEDYPRNYRLPKYAPSQPKLAGERFAKLHRDNYSFLIGRLSCGDAFERLCAFECLEYMCWEFGVGAVPQEILQVSEPLPSTIIAELSGDADASGFSGTTIGAWLSHVFSG